jgi:hypothetical protein
VPGRPPESTGRAIAYDPLGFFFSFVIPAEAGIQDCRSVLVALDLGFRRGDGRKKGLSNPFAIALP